MDPLKQPKTFDQQISKLIENHNLAIHDKESAKLILSRVNYYRLSAYGLGLHRKDDKEKFICGITIEHLYNLYCFDCYMRNLLTPLIEMLEVELRTLISYHLSIKYGSEGYRDSSNFLFITNKDGDSIHQKTMKRLDKTIDDQKNLPCVKHHNSKYGGHFPAWAAVELFSFGMLSSLYSVMKQDDKKVIAAHFMTKPEHLQGWILALVEVRNICAHFGRVYNMPLAQKPFLYSEYSNYQGNKIFPLLLTIKRMIRVQNIWNDFYNQFEALIYKYPEVNLRLMGFPDNWKTLLRV